MISTTDYDYRLDPNYVSTWTPTQELIDLVFTLIFTFEATTKIIAMGFVLHKRAYLQDSWNCLDFFIVCISLISLLPIGGGSNGLKALRTFRILRPLRSINKLP